MSEVMKRYLLLFFIDFKFMEVFALPFIVSWMHIGIWFRKGGR